jgi:hypothetical protein
MVGDAIASGFRLLHGFRADVGQPRAAFDRTRCWHRRGLAAKAAAQAQAAAASDRASSRILLEKACAGRNDLSELVE